MKTNFKRIFALSMAALLAANSPLQASETDDRIVSAAQSSYVFQTFLKDDSIQTQSKNGIVTLKGTVKHDSHKELAQITVQNLPGVKSVKNQLKFKGINPGVTSDEFLEMKIMMALSFLRQLGDSKPQIDVQNGVAVLRGEVGNEDQLKRIAEYARDVEGIKGVRNEMTAAKTPGQPVQSAQKKIDDASVTAQVMLSLMTHRSTSAIKTSVSTKDGIVTLDGKTKSLAEKNLVTVLASDIYGVRSVVNTMTVAK